jgi:MmyB-like transcription regulator ligand binding domain
VPVKAAVVTLSTTRREKSFYTLVRGLTAGAGCPEFAVWWEAHDIRSVVGGQRLSNHPKKGVLRFEHASFHANEDPALKLVIFTPVWSDLGARESARQLEKCHDAE